MISERSAPAIRLLLVFVGALLLAAALFPEVGLAPVHSLVVQMRSPEKAAPTARVFFAIAAASSFLLAAWWDSVNTLFRRSTGLLLSMRSRTYWLCVAAAAAIPRVMAFMIPYEPTSDSQWYHEVALALAQGSGVVFDGVPTAFRSPGYAYVLSLAYRLTGPQVAGAWLVGSLATAVLLVSTFIVGLRTYGTACARIVTLLAALYPALVIMTGQTLSDLLFTAGLVAVLAMLLGVSPLSYGHALVAGAALGALALCRSAGALLVFIVPAVWWLRGSTARAAVLAGCIAAIACGACLLPWMQRNAEVLGRFTLGTNAGSNLAVGNRAGASGWYEPFKEISPAAGELSAEVARDDALRAQVWTFVREHPMDALGTLPAKFTALYLLETEAVSSLFQGNKRGPDTVRSFLYVVSQLAWLATAVLVLARMASWRSAAQRPVGTQWCGWLLVGYFTAVALVFHGEDRYRLPILPVLLLEAVAFCVYRLGWAAVPPLNLAGFQKPR